MKTDLDIEELTSEFRDNLCTLFNDYCCGEIVPQKLVDGYYETHFYYLEKALEGYRSIDMQYFDGLKGKLSEEEVELFNEIKCQIHMFSEVLDDKDLPEQTQVDLKPRPKIPKDERIEAYTSCFKDFIDQLRKN